MLWLPFFMRLRLRPGVNAKTLVQRVADEKRYVQARRVPPKPLGNTEVKFLLLRTEGKGYSCGI